MDVDFRLDSEEVRVLGSLIEKEIATPEYYPLTLNALVNACNQRSSRDPVVDYDEATVEQAIERLRAKKLASVVTGAGLRVPKHRELFSETLNLGRREVAILCLLMLRGHQTAGELHNRAGRLYEFSDIQEVEACLERLMTGREPPLVACLPRRPGTKEPRYAHLLSGAVETAEPLAAPGEEPAPEARAGGSRVAALEAEVARLREDLESLRREFAEFRSQFG
jgi:uncharacterized protein YceH (UPF0502 family)